jgi:signal transduction histidine kinase
MVLGSPSALHSAFLNLGINASHAISGGGCIVYTLSPVSIDEAYCHDSSFPLRPGEYLKLTVEDTGSGIPPKNLDRIFDALFTTKEAGKGTGLGLSSVLRTVKDHSGEIRVTSTVGEGTVFTMLFPAVERDRPHPSDVEPSHDEPS